MFSIFVTINSFPANITLTRRMHTDNICCFSLWYQKLKNWKKQNKNKRYKKQIEWFNLTCSQWLCRNNSRAEDDEAYKHRLGNMKWLKKKLPLNYEDFAMAVVPSCFFFFHFSAYYNTFEHVPKYKCQEVINRLNAFLNGNYNTSMYVPGDCVKCARLIDKSQLILCLSTKCHKAQKNYARQ